MDAQTKLPAILLAPCGMNCGTCRAYLRDRNRCAGCAVDSPQKLHHCFVCRIKNCTGRPADARFCYSCTKYPCTRLRQLDIRYRTKYSVSFIENLNKIKDIGPDRFMEAENTRWKCPACGNVVCVHDRRCYHCDGAAKTEPLNR